jgi:nucleoside-diphosphate-sugar epimerase
MPSKIILVTGAAGQLGTDLLHSLAKRYPDASLLATDLFETVPAHLAQFPYQPLDVLDGVALRNLLSHTQPTEIYHLAALLSGTAEQRPELAWYLNVSAYKALLDACRELLPTVKLFFPSSIAVFGPGCEKTDTPQTAYLDPTSMYGITKVADEQLSNYYHHKYGLDIRSLRFPGIISSKAKPGGGTTDYSVEIFLAFAQGQDYTCYLTPNTLLPLIHIEDSLNAIHQLMESDGTKLQYRTSYNINGISATPADFERELKAINSQFEVAYAPDFRQAIADSWPGSLADDAARADWGWQPTYNLSRITSAMLSDLKAIATLS